MDDNLLKELRQKLEKEKKVLQNDLSAIAGKDKGEEVPGAYDPKFPDYGEDHVPALDDNAPTEVADYSVNVNSTGELESRLKDVEDALEKMDADDKFGYCEKCGESISLERMEANPAARTCVNCMSK